MKIAPAARVQSDREVTQLTDYGPLKDLVGAYGGPYKSSGLNLIHRPSSAKTPTPGMPSGATSVLQVSEILENLRFLDAPGILGVPVNRGSFQQGDVTLVPVFYEQYVEDKAVPETLANLASGAGVIHNESGMWLLQPVTNDQPAVVQRLAVIPHGVAFIAEGTYSTVTGAPVIPPVSAVPFKTDTGEKLPTPSLTASATGTARLPQTLPATVTQEVLDDPNTLLRNAIKGKNITSTVVLSVDSDNGGVSNTGFLKKNAVCTRVRSTFYIETVNLWGFSSPQIQYFQEVFLEFGGVTYPHITVATLGRDPLPSPVVI